MHLVRFHRLKKRLGLWSLNPHLAVHPLERCGKRGWQWKLSESLLLVSCYQFAGLAHQQESVYLYMTLYLQMPHNLLWSDCQHYRSPLCKRATMWGPLHQRHSNPGTLLHGATSNANGKGSPSLLRRWRHVQLLQKHPNRVFKWPTISAPLVYFLQLCNSVQPFVTELWGAIQRGIRTVSPLQPVTWAVSISQLLCCCINYIPPVRSSMSITQHLCNLGYFIVSLMEELVAQWGIH